MKKLLNYINGNFQEAISGKWLDNFDPATGQVYARVPASDQQDVEVAVQAASAAFPAWADTPIGERSRILMRVADLIEERLEELALAECIDNGKPLWLAKEVDIPRAAANFRYFANAVTQYYSETYDMGSRGFNYTLRRPIGVAGLISPWNLPLYLFSWKVAPAVAAGNTCVAKPSEVTPMTAFLLSQICKDAGVPDGVINIVHGLGGDVGASIVAHPKVAMISFTGSTLTGRKITEVAGPMFKKLSLEMGGKNPNLVFADCDFEKAVKGSVRAAFTNQGQICLCGSRILVERSIYDRFVEEFVRQVKELTVGDPLEEGTRVGAIVSKDQFEKDLLYMDIARQEGGTILTGGKAAAAPNERCKNGWFLEPTVITGLAPHCRVNQEEIFGPVVTIWPFDTEAEAISAANSTTYGLSATLWTENLRRAHRVAAELHSGIVWVNSWLVRDLRTPFGGVKQSGIGREGGFEALHFFTEPKNVYIHLGD
ncbi:MAG: aldehyde dehydrogenase [Bacteroidia bacterium]|nr:aldehyde dehydrogenase [Bacteroidia bacterium]